MQRIYIWDFPTRLFHWLLVLAIASQYITAKFLDDAMHWHSYGGYFILGLVIFRVLWGIWGAYYAKFSQFITSPMSVWRYAKNINKGAGQANLGHNPLGAYAILFILLVLAVQAISGLFITDDIFFNGPYYPVASDLTRDVMNWLHNRGFYVIWLFLAAHLIAMLVYKLWLKQNLVKSMLTGYKQQQHNGTPIAAKNHWLKFGLIDIVSIIAVYLIVVTFAPDVVDEFYF